MELNFTQAYVETLAYFHNYSYIWHKTQNQSIASVSKDTHKLTVNKLTKKHEAKPFTREDALELVNTLNQFKYILMYNEDHDKQAFRSQLHMSGIQWE